LPIIYNEEWLIIVKREIDTLYVSESSPSFELFFYRLVSLTTGLLGIDRFGNKSEDAALKLLRSLLYTRFQCLLFTEKDIPVLGIDPIYETSPFFSEKK
jgi:hypothetical protein